METKQNFSVRYFLEILKKLKLAIYPLISRKIIVLYFIIMIPLLIYSIYKNRLELKKETIVEEEKIIPMVKVFEVKVKNFKDVLYSMGTVKGTSEIELKFEIPGKIATFNFRMGDSIAKGEVIVAIDSGDVITKLRYARSRLDATTARYLATKEKIAVYRELYHMGAIIKAKMTEMDLEVGGLKSQVEAARLEVKIAQSQLDKTVISAPDDGIMGVRQVEEGDFVTPNDTVGRFLKVEDVFVEVGVIEKEIGKLSVGQRVKLKVDAYPGEYFWGTIDVVSKMIRGETRTLPVKVKVLNPEGKLLSGMFAECEIFLFEVEDTIIIPVSSAINLGEMTVVPLVKLTDEDSRSPIDKIGVVELRQVIPGHDYSTYIQILDGLEKGDIIVMETQQALTDGMEVKIIEVVNLEADD